MAKAYKEIILFFNLNSQSWKLHVLAALWKVERHEKQKKLHQRESAISRLEMITYRMQKPQ